MLGTGRDQGWIKVSLAKVEHFWSPLPLMGGEVVGRVWRWVSKV